MEENPELTVKESKQLLLKKWTLLSEQEKKIYI
jgi:hypothetical protein